ncbi:low affinity iron transporter-like protein [Penicillium cinerascens]|uniref:Low affinity iron transporter-like protein n=1 Tax=Penicillium cinerascens TaxID=70096 RepID=A0A9W9TE21_9EURO|nr:low affinity iron transporter-like protein [Penicillium cinerascens]KAJ5218165.1 low affinity iron transporter-like protein [Penicillium cinerascens]
MAATEGSGFVPRALSILRRPWEVVTCNAYENIQGTAPIRRPGQSQEAWTHDSAKYENNDDLESNHKLDEPSASVNLFDKIVSFAGTPFVFLFMIALLLAWMIIGIVLGPSQTWQIVIQNTSSIQCYASDTLLMRQQRNNSHDLLSFVCELRSRNETCRRMIERLRQEHPSYFDSQIQEEIDQKKSVELNIQPTDDGAHLPPHTLYDRICDPLVWAFSSLYAWIVFWAGIFVWLGFGNSQQWGNNWQLYINSATAVELTFISVFLQNTRQRHMRYLEECFESIAHEGTRLECRLREITGDMDPNPTVEFEYDYKKETTRGQRVIDYYATIVGTGVGLVISSIVFAVWIGVGSLMQWNSNWWLIIGTYTGLVGFIDGFVLRNVYYRGSRIVDEQFEVLAKEDARLGTLLGMTESSTESIEIDSLQTRIASKVGEWCSRSSAVLGAFVTIVALLVIASALKWSETGQLLCNTPTMIIEGFLLLVLIQAHNIANMQRRLQFRDSLRRRMAMTSQVYSLVPKGGVNIGGEKVSANL